LLSAARTPAVDLDIAARNATWAWPQLFASSGGYST